MTAPVPSFSDLGLLPELLQAVAEKGYTEPTPIQVQAIPVILQGLDVMGGAQTGTGKTAGFTLPLLQRLAAHANTSVSPARHPVRALIITPTRELAAQVEESVRAYGKHLGLRPAVVFGGVDIVPQIQALRAGVEILVATPGRLLDHVQQKTVMLGQVEILVLDEADRMLDMGFMPDIRRILALLPAKRQNLLFSATLSEEIKRLADNLLHQPVLIEVARRNAMTELVSHEVHPVRRERKRDLLAHLVRTQHLSQVLVFGGTRLGVNRLAYQLQRDGVRAAAIHGDRSQAERIQALADFKSGKTPVLVATDVAARGLDIQELPAVINFELPGAPEDYLHRIGRTGRAGSTGRAISLVCADEHEKLAAIEKFIKQRIPQTIIPGFEPDASGVSALMHTERERPERRPERGSSLTRGGARSHAARAPAKPVDTIFSAPYVPSSAASPAAEPVRSGPQKPGRQVAALLGGLRKSG
ncbi:MAG: DEAD/DEAH box helicase [Betaproteobacteria bacterium]|nr:DEAD/DEAH box helicase [Betaproteobacteria bacterium]